MTTEEQLIKSDANLRKVRELLRKQDHAILCATEFINDWKKGDFILKGLAAIDAQALADALVSAAATRMVNGEVPKDHPLPEHHGALPTPAPRTEQEQPVAAKEARTCDECQYQEGNHYCLLRTMVVKNMDITTCSEWQPRPSQQPNKI